MPKQHLGQNTQYICQQTMKSWFFNSSRSSFIPSFFTWKGTLSHTYPSVRYGWNNSLELICIVACKQFFVVEGAVVRLVLHVGRFALLRIGRVTSWHPRRVSLPHGTLVGPRKI